MTSAIEAAKNAIGATDEEENALLIAELIHNLGFQRKSAHYEQIANARADGEPFRRTLNLPTGGQHVTYIPDEKGKAKDPDGNKVKSIKQHLDDLQKCEEDLWKQANDEGIRPKVVKALASIQESTIKKMTASTENGAES
jgi:hypothetical protein